MKAMPALAFLVSCMMASGGDGPKYLMDEGSLLYGPYEFKVGEKIRVGDMNLVVMAPSKTLDLLRRLKQTIIPEIRLEQANFRDVLAFLEQESGKNAPVEFKQEPVPMLLDLKGGAAPGEASADRKIDESQPPAISFSGRYISVLSAIKILSSVAGYTVILDEDAVRFQPKSSTMDAETGVCGCEEISVTGGIDLFQDQPDNEPERDEPSCHAPDDTHKP